MFKDVSFFAHLHSKFAKVTQIFYFFYSTWW